MSSYTKPGPKDIETNPLVEGYVCSICKIKYSYPHSKERCELWHKEVENTTLNNE